MRIAVTGANGFVGRAIVGALQEGGHEVRALVRSAADASKVAGDVHVVGDLSKAGDLRPAFESVDVVVHAAGWSGAAAGNRKATDLAASELEAAKRVSSAAMDARISHVILISSIKALGSKTAGQPFTADTEPRPCDLYGNSKRACEVVFENAATSQLQVTIIRPPLVYGPGMKSNLLKIFEAARLGWRLPLARSNKRDMIFSGSLATFVRSAIAHPPRQSPRRLLVKDGSPVSTAELYRMIAQGFGTHARALPVPAKLVARALRLAGSVSIAESLFASLEVDDSASRQAVAWRPDVETAVGLALTARWLTNAREHGET